MADAKRINLALQGGGAHGAFTWGVLDCLLDSDEVEIAGISGTSAGAINGAALKSGLVHDRATAKGNLAWLWGRIAGVGDLKITSWLNTFAPATAELTQMMENSLPFTITDMLAQTTSPYQLGPFYRNPLSPIVKDLRFSEICSPDGPALFVSATNVRTGKIRVFGHEEVTTDVLLASACLPTLFQAVEIDGEAYWDGGYTGNPALFPLFDGPFPNDIVIVNINPIVRHDLPYRPNDILNRINEISFNSSLLRELRAIRFVQRLIEEGKMEEGAMRYILVHMIADDDLMNDLSAATKLLPSALLIERLFEAGRRAAQGFLDKDLENLGKRSSIDLADMYD